MNIPLRLLSSRLLAALLSATVTLPAAADVLYKAVEPDGTVVITDVPSAGDEAMAIANTRVDIAEHAFALARRGGGGTWDKMGMRDTRTSPGDRQRAAFYMKDVVLARAQLTKLRHERAIPSPSYELVALR